MTAPTPPTPGPANVGPTALALAEHFLGWRLAERPTGSPAHPTAYQVVDENGGWRSQSPSYFGWGWHATREEALADLPPFCTDTGSALWLLQKTATRAPERGASVLASLCLAGTADQWVVTLHAWTETQPVRVVTGDTGPAPLAQALCEALWAVRELFPVPPTPVGFPATGES